MSQKNVDFLKRHYFLRARQSVGIIPIWGASPERALPAAHEIRRIFQIPENKKVVVFGGQLTAGRGIEQIVECAKLLDESENIIFLVVGSGSLSFLVENYITEGGENIVMLGPMSRLDYLRLISACDAGLVITVDNVSVPTFPSKTIDYLRAGLPIVAAVESTTDYREFIENNKLGIVVDVGNCNDLVRALRRLFDEKKSVLPERRRLIQFFEDTFDVNMVSSRMLEFVGES